MSFLTVFAQAKLLNLKQITTLNHICFHSLKTVFAQAKLLNLKQITTTKGFGFIELILYLHKQSY